MPAKNNRKGGGKLRNAASFLHLRKAETFSSDRNGLTDADAAAENWREDLDIEMEDVSFIYIPDCFEPLLTEDLADGNFCRCLWRAC